MTAPSAPAGSAGLGAHHWSHGEAASGVEEPRIPSAIVGRWLTHYRGQWTHLARATGISAHTLWQYRTGRVRWASYDAADRLAIHLGHTLPPPGPSVLERNAAWHELARRLICARPLGGGEGSPS